MMIPKMSEKIFWRYFALFSPQDVSRDLWRGRRQAVDHLGADLIQDLVLETVLLRTSNCISSGFCLYFFAFLWVCTAVYIVACFRLFYSSLTRWGFHTPVRHMEKMMKMMIHGQFFIFWISCTPERESKCVDFKSVSAIHRVTCKRPSGGAGEIYRCLICSNLGTYKQSYTIIDKEISDMYGSEWVNIYI